jgi:hypothetical protein
VLSIEPIYLLVENDIANDIRWNILGSTENEYSTQKAQCFDFENDLTRSDFRMDIFPRGPVP